MGFFTAEILRILNMVLKVVSQTYCLQNFFFFFFPQRICEHFFSTKNLWTTLGNSAVLFLSLCTHPFLSCFLYSFFGFLSRVYCAVRWSCHYKMPWDGDACQKESLVLIQLHVHHKNSQSFMILRNVIKWHVVSIALKQTAFLKEMFWVSMPKFTNLNLCWEFRWFIIFAIASDSIIYIFLQY